MGSVIGAITGSSGRKEARRQQEEALGQQRSLQAKQAEKIKKQEEKQREEFGRAKKGLLSGRFGRRQTFFQGNQTGVEQQAGNRTTLG